MTNLYVQLGRTLFPLLLPLMRPILNRTSRVYIAIIYEGKILLVKNWLARDTWRFPGGGVSKSEMPENTAIREIKEEIRMVLKSSQLIKLYDAHAADDKLAFPYVVYAYQIQITPKILADKYEIVDYDWFSEPPANCSDGITRAFDLLKDRGLV